MYDLAWQAGWFPLLFTLVLVIIQWWLVSRLLRAEIPEETADLQFGQALTWGFFGSFLFLEFLIFTNIAWAASSTGLSYPAAFALLLGAHLLGLLLIMLPPRVKRTIY